MTLRAALLRSDPGDKPPLLEALKGLFARMDQAYAAVARQYGFECHGCTDNCCLTRFYHHTLAEYLLLYQGIQGLDAPSRDEIYAQAKVVCDQMAAADRKGEKLRILCPLNVDGRCRLYAHRPMICRLHGIPSELQRPGGAVQRLPGCDLFFDQCRRRGQSDYIRFDRTPLYRDMALLEKQLRQQCGHTEPIKLSVAEMLVTFTPEDHEID